MEFSCSPVVNEYVKSNILKFSQISIDEFLIFDTPVQRAAFRSFSPERKFEIWSEKLKKVLYFETWTDQEAKHINDLINHLCIEYFMEGEKYDSIKIENRIFAGNWIDYAINKLKWDKRKLAFVVSSLHISFAEYEYSLSRLRDVKAIASENTETNCDCNTGADFCNYEPGSTCSSTGCKASSSGCGWLWMEECNGNCI
ncbi:hypothetical protein ES708_25915 [subsurface metagenome]